MPYVLAAVIVTIGLYFALGLRRFLLLVLIPCVIAATIYGSWYYFSSEYDKTKSAEKQKLAQLHKEQHAKKSTEELWGELVGNTRRIEKNARAGYHYESDPDDTSPLGVMRFEAPEYNKFNDEDLLSKVRERYYPAIPKEKFNQWARDAYGQEKIDAYLKETAQPN